MEYGDRGVHFLEELGDTGLNQLWCEELALSGNHRRGQRRGQVGGIAEWGGCRLQLLGLSQLRDNLCSAAFRPFFLRRLVEGAGQAGLHAILAGIDSITFDLESSCQAPYGTISADFTYFTAMAGITGTFGGISPCRK